MGAFSKELAVESEEQQLPWILRNPRAMGALALAGTIACQQGVPKLLGAALMRSPVGSTLSMVGAAAATAAEAAAPSIWASEGVQKSASFFTMIFVGFILRFKITNPMFAKGIQALIMNSLLPCVTFKVRVLPNPTLLPTLDLVD